MNHIEKEIFKDSTDGIENLYPALFQCFSIIICGYIAGRFNIISPKESKGIATFVGTFALPALIFLSLAQLDFTIVNWSFLLSMLGAKALIFFGVAVVTAFITKPMDLGRAGIFAIFCTQSNDFALGYPIINALYNTKHPEYALYLYLMAPISLAILNPFAFVMMELNKQRELNGRIFVDLKTMLQVLKGIALNPVLVMTILGIIGNVLFKHQLNIYLNSLLESFSQAFAATALFLLGLRMVGQIHRLRGPALLVPLMLITVKLVILPIVMKEGVNASNPGADANETQALSTYAFLYGTIPTAPAVFVFSNMYQLEIDLIASSMVICTFISAPIMFMTAEMISIDVKNYDIQLEKLAYGISIVSLVTSIWVLFVFIFTKKYKRMPHLLTMCLVLSQTLLAASVIWSEDVTASDWTSMIPQGLKIFSMFSCMLWTSMMAVGILMLQSRGPCFLQSLTPVLAFVAWCTPTVMTIILAVTKGAQNFNMKAAEAIRLCLLVFCLTVTTGCLILYIRFRKQRQETRRATLPTTSSPNDEESRLILNEEPIAQSVNGYGAIAVPSPKRDSRGCSENATCGNCGHTEDIEDIAEGNQVSDCSCPNGANHARCQYVTEWENSLADLGIASNGNPSSGSQLFKHTVLIILYSVNMFVSLSFTFWRVMLNDVNGVYVEVEFLDMITTYGQALAVFVLFGIDPDEMIIPAVRFLKKKWYGGDELLLPAVEDLSFETKHVCDQFITHHLEQCKQKISKTKRYRMRTYRDAFPGTCLVRWLISSKLAKDETEAIDYGRHLLDGRLIAHVNNAHHFSNSALLYKFN